MNNICVFCGSSTGNNPEFKNAARALGAMIAEQNKTLIYGGGNVGLMGAVADAVLENGGRVIGVIPDFLLQREVGHQNLTELIVVESMHERKQKMAKLADAFIALPGGFGTLEEMAEIVTWVQLELVKKPIGLLNIAGYYDNLINQLNVMTTNGFTSHKHRAILKATSNPAAMLDLLDKEQESTQESKLNRT